MPRRAKYAPEKDKDPELDISSLIDVSFLLLIYFLVTSTLRKEETDLKIVLPTQIPTDNPDPVDPVAIKVEADGSITYDGQPISGPSNSGKPDKLQPLRDRLKEYKELANSTGNTPMVIVAASDDGKTQRFIDVVNALASVKINNITMTGFRDEEG